MNVSRKTIGQMSDEDQRELFLTLLNRYGSEGQVVSVPIDRIRENPRNPRRYFDRTKLDSLAASLRNNQQFEPALVVPEDDGKFMLITGHRRYRAALIAGRRELQVWVRPYSETFTEAHARVALVASNTQQEKYSNWMETARAVDELMLAGKDSDEAAAELGIGAASTARGLRSLVYLPECFQKAIEQKKLKWTFGREISIRASDDTLLLERIWDAMQSSPLDWDTREKIAMQIMRMKRSQIRLRVDLKTNVAILEGQPFPLNPDSALMLAKILAARGELMSGKEMAIVRPDRCKFPKPIAETFDSVKGKGYRLKPEFCD